MDLSDMTIPELETQLARTQAACEQDVSIRTAESKAKAERVRVQITLLRSLDLSPAIDFELCATAASSPTMDDPSRGGRGGDVGSLRAALYNAGKSLESLIPGLEADVLKLDRPAYPTFAFDRSISAIKAEISARKNAKAERLATLRAELEELGVGGLG